MKDFRKYALLASVAWSAFVIYHSISIFEPNMDWTYNLGGLIATIALTVPLLAVTSWRYKTRLKQKQI